MAALNAGLRGQLEKAVLAAREQAEKAAEAALCILAVERGEAFSSHTLEQRRLRVGLRARARQLGGSQMDGLSQLLLEEVAYEQWHRMLFARFLAENDLLRHPGGALVTLQDCAELAREESGTDAWQLAARYASALLPGIFRADDPSAQVTLAPEGQAALEVILANIPTPVFTSDDGLGWVYQYWQTKRRKEVTRSRRKIGSEDLPAVTQFFTEDYMVRFLLENSLGAWWASRHPDSQLVKDFSYLRLRDDGTPAAGTFAGWPERAAEVTVMDPCCGSGHFLVAALGMLRYMRMEEEGLGEAEAADAVLRDNLFGLEIDPRCVQIAAFALALAAWRVGGYRTLPLPNVACSGMRVTGQSEEWTKNTNSDGDLKLALERLYELFKTAPDLGSLINPADVPIRDRMFSPDYAKIVPLLERALAAERSRDDPVAAVFDEAARGLARASEILTSRYILVATNVPYLSNGKQCDALRLHCEAHFKVGKADLATAFILRCRDFTARGGTYAVVSPQAWLFLGSFQRLRIQLLCESEWNVVVKLGPAAFTGMNWWAATTSLLIATNSPPSLTHEVIGIEASTSRITEEKRSLVRATVLQAVSQRSQLANPDARIIFGEVGHGPLLKEFAFSYQGIKIGV